MDTDRPVITSLLDNDQYKTSMGQVVFNQFPEAVVTYGFTNRGGTVFLPSFPAILKKHINMMADIRMTDAEYQFLKLIRFTKPTYLEWFRNYRFNPDEVTVSYDDRTGNLKIRVHGPWYRTIYWEVPLMALISELFFRDNCRDGRWLYRIIAKAEKMSSAGLNWIDFGTRRRESFEVQDAVVRHQKSYKGFRGTSNMLLAMIHNVKSQGTMAHEMFMAMQAKYGIRMANQMTLDHWVKEFNGDLGIMLPDTLTTDVFLKTLSRRDAKLFDGARLDSGDLVAAGEKILNRYTELDVDPKSKVLVPSDSLTDDSAISIARHFEGKVKGVTAGIGTFLSNDCGHKPLNMVIKMVDADFGFGPVDVVKLSDIPGKYTGNPEMIKHAKQELGIL